jgi:cytosine/adenosine deaminase-related metal-dependent hydrolase
VRMLINARNRSVAIEGERIVHESGRFDLVLDCRDLDVRPGLINAHDHLHRNHYGRLGAGTYSNAYLWAEDIQVRYRRRIANGRKIPRREALLAGAWKNLFAGVTTVVHHDAWEPDFDRDFPIRVAQVACADSLGMDAHVEAPAGGPFCLHVAEGIDDIAAAELPALEERGLLNDRLVAVHGIGIESRGIERFKRSGAAIVWCPTSNNFLFGRTASAKLLDGGSDVLLGSDSRLTGAGDLLDELQAARATGLVDDARLENAVGSACARRLGLPEPSLEPGSAADLIMLGRPLLEADTNDVAMAVVAGVPRVARLDVAARMGPLAEAGTKMRLGRVVRWVNEQGRIA